MLSKLLPVAMTVAAVAAIASSSVFAADFSGPAGWSRVAVTSPSTTRTIEQWHISGDTSTSVTYVQDTSVTYADSMAAIAKNFSDNGIKASNKDMPCRGATAHVIEFAAGPDGSKTIINRMILSQGTGIATITYSRADGNAFDDEVKKAESAYCAST